jgi:RES domain-containing protein
LRLQGTVWRAHNPAWSWLPTSGEGAARHGGRFNRVGLPALYTSRRMETAWLEAQQGFPFKAQPMLICGYDVDCDNIADLTDAATCGAFDITPADLACAWEDLALKGKTPPSWTMVDRLIAAGHWGIVVPSFAPKSTALDINVVFWQWADAPPHQVRVIDDHHRLPKNDASWR